MKQELTMHFSSGGGVGGVHAWARRLFSLIWGNLFCFSFSISEITKQMCFTSDIQAVVLQDSLPENERKNKFPQIEPSRVEMLNPAFQGAMFGCTISYPTPPHARHRVRK